MTPAALLADPEGLEVMVAVALERERARHQQDLAARFAAGERGIGG